VQPISLVVITFNEAYRIRECLESALGVADDVLVVDSLSTDGTPDMARAMGARVISQPFLGYIEQKAFAIREALHDRVLLLDADERLSKQLADSVQRVKRDWSADGYACNRLNHLGNQPLHHGGWYPDRKVRLFDRRKCQVGGVDPHDRIVMDEGTRTAHLQGDILHFTNKDLADRVATVNRFSTRAAAAMAARGQRGNIARLITKPAFRFFREYVLQCGFLDGLPGFLVAATSSQYVWLREAKLLEQKSTETLVAADPQRLERAYLETAYHVEGFRTPIRIGESHAELIQWLGEIGQESWVYITAFNPGSVMLTAPENEQRNSALQQALTGRHFLSGQGVGRSTDWPAESSFLVAGISREDGITLGRRFGQTAIVGGRLGSPAELWWC
jgi:glycosyltransferase involved in cell wall biosynthesis